MHLWHVVALGSLLRCAMAVLALWSLVSVIVAVPVAALFRMQARADRLWQEADRRRTWQEVFR